MADPIQWYDAHADTVAERYEAIAADELHAWLQDLLPAMPAAVLDVGAGSGRDAVWLAKRGYDVVAIEPSAAMRAAAARLHDDVRVRWVDDALPSLTTVTRSGLSFDVVLLSAIWMHVPTSERPRAFRKLINILRPGGLLVITLRHGPAEPERGIHAVSLAEIERLALDHGAFVERSVEAGDRLGRPDVRWTQVAVRLPDDGTGALPLLRHVILNDDKSSSYKLALLRALCRVADGAAGLARDRDDDYVAVPLGLVALTWIRLFKPLLEAGLPQSPTNVGYTRLGFVKDAFRKIGTVSHLDLRVGLAFSGETAAALHQALRDAAETVARMPATYMTYPNGGSILPVERSRPPRGAILGRLDEAYLASFGTMLVPRHLWRALQRFDAWIEPALVTEWGRLIKLYAERQGRRIEDGALATAMAWSDPTRDVRIAREQAVRLLTAGRLFCVWSGQRLTEHSIELDHCLPWSAWPCGDLWNLMPAHREINQREKRARLPADALLRSCQDRIVGWWEGGYTDGNEAIRERFWLEAASSLPGVEGDSDRLHDVFVALCLQRMKLKHDQQVPEWAGERYVGSG